MSLELAPYSAQAQTSLGRVHTEPSEPTKSGRNPFQRDRDRILHCAAFRRLEYKTQVFLNHEGDDFRTRLTHSLEVAQIGRAIARRLQLNEDLVEAISLAHDLGHTPFGHAGQDALNACMHQHDGFEHNLQSLWVVDELEERYPTFNGLNLSYETREGILKHVSRKNIRIHGEWLGNLADRFENNLQPSLEAQLANIADEVAYSNHDIDDGIRSGLLEMPSLNETELWNTRRQIVLKMYPNLEGRRLRHEVIRHMIHVLIDDLVNNSKLLIEQYQPKSIDDVRHLPPLISFSDSMKNQVVELKSFLFKNLYRHPRVVDVTQGAAAQIEFMFSFFLENPHEIPAHFRTQDINHPHRRIAHYIAGMTDRFARSEFMRFSS
ncbi:deoxyguanosinetriphosphate triphosphohydrolase-like protein [Polynucleobacter sp. SHI8]|uniref:deoxyguanosinetriphosphate triphosphohydrolase n=1 Tax=unclassified Polynucleobacter TaxID=2640945 RepID=UPI0024937E47|nr:MULTISPECIES: deoxyguanosinetriphosphate triphosphohydrolase [unclassified Polynucleobacter]BDW10007.1 deoxyguanosinetriphosphate triphosphohydrolase-like protein [Polynucleobacter sp. SHI2]BDW12453.1 deoxyguanosinetriphosphate triphosphohydrolase-like protein [Polynucleobacter sp. SHI8]